MLHELEILVDFVEQKYEQLLNEWKISDLYVQINQRKILVKNISEDRSLLSAVLNYRTFINDKNLELKMGLDSLNLESEINTRVKAQNSIEQKINNYMTERHEYGEIPMKKCFNDLYGIRIIFEEEVNHKEIEEFINSRFCEYDLKCIDSSKPEGYVATHIYFQKDNKSFSWELQIWDKSHEESNISLHRQYKQAYTKWELENKGGESF